MLKPNVHFDRIVAQLRSKQTPLEKFIFLSQLKHADTNLFYSLLVKQMAVRLARLSLQSSFTHSRPTGGHATDLHPNCRGSLRESPQPTNPLTCSTMGPPLTLTMYAPLLLAEILAHLPPSRGHVHFDPGQGLDPLRPLKLASTTRPSPDRRR